MSNSVPLCTHRMTTGATCGSPAVSGTTFCYHHSSIKAALGRMIPIDQVPYGMYLPIPFVFPEDRASLQINYFLLLQALSEQRIELKTANAMMRMMKAMAANLGKKPLADDGGAQEDRAQGDSDQRSAVSGQESGALEGGDQRSAASVQEGGAQEGGELTAQCQGDEVTSLNDVNGATKRPLPNDGACRIGMTRQELEDIYYGRSTPAA